MYNYDFYYTPLLTGNEKRYIIQFPPEVTPVHFWTITTDMRSWLGEVVEIAPDVAGAVVRQGNSLVTIVGRRFSELLIGMPCYVMEHLNIDGSMEYLINNTDIQLENKNFVNFGIPNGKHIRIDIYTGESRTLDG